MTRVRLIKIDPTGWRDIRVGIVRFDSSAKTNCIRCPFCTWEMLVERRDENRESLGNVLGIPGTVRWLPVQVEGHKKEPEYYETHEPDDVLEAHIKTHDVTDLLKAIHNLEERLASASARGDRTTDLLLFIRSHYPAMWEQIETDPDAERFLNA